MKKDRKKRIGIIFSGGSLVTTSHNKNVKSVETANDIHDWFSELPELSLLADSIPFFVSGDTESFSIETIEIVAALLQREEGNFDGFVVLTNAEALPFLASAIEFMLQGFEKPIVFTGSRFKKYELVESSIKAFVKKGLLGLRSNLINAYQIIVARNISGSVVMFGSRIIQPTHAIIDDKNGLNFLKSADGVYIGKVDFGITINQVAKTGKGRGRILSLGRNFLVLDSKLFILSNYSNGMINANDYILLRVHSESDLDHKAIKSLLEKSDKVLLYSDSALRKKNSISNITWPAVIMKALWAAHISNSVDNFFELVKKDQVGETLTV